MKDTIELLQDLLEQHQFELLIPENENTDRLRLVYLMNDAVESFLVFVNAGITGLYQKDYEGELDYSLSREGQGYVLSVWQGKNVVTLFFRKLELEVHLYDYGEIGHFWVKGYEYLRQLEYRIAIIRDKLEYLGEEFCTEEEICLAHLANFPPLNYCCYPAVPEQYIVPGENPWMPSEAAFKVMDNLSKETQDASLLRLLKLYKRLPYPFMARMVAGALHKRKHQAVVRLLTEKIKHAAGTYPDRSFGVEADNKLKELLEKAEQIKRNMSIRDQDIQVDILREEPFTTAQDDVDFHVYLMIWDKKGINCRVKILRIPGAKEFVL